MKNEILYSLKPQYMDMILKGDKSHEYRNVIPKVIPKRLWFYITKPKYQLEYLVDVLEPIFKPDKDSKIAFPISKIHKIQNPISLKDLREKYNFTPPQGFVYMSKYPNLYYDIMNNFNYEENLS